MVAVARCESSLNPTAVGDTHLTCPMTGQPIRSRGIVQIADCYHPNVSDDQAFDPDFSAEFMAQKFSEGKQGLWSCSRIVGII
jgi:hypothetical protein